MANSAMLLPPCRVVGRHTIALCTPVGVTAQVRHLTRVNTRNESPKGSAAQTIAARLRAMTLREPARRDVFMTVP